ncbi:hypothetical protein Tco_1067608 [Tanacetum coccineum]|uniref:Retrotransposon gag domain-containing protein n=1 Tax=Tanacetum coccineum TaxID=301880 RepID=A0ABQ5HDD4_9ASTR
MASDGSDPDAEYALSRLLQRGTVAEYQNEFEMLISRVTRRSEFLLTMNYISGLKVSLQIEVLSARTTTLGEAFSLACITVARFEEESNLAVDTIVGDQEDPEVKDKQVKKADDREIKNIKDEEDESWFLAHEIDYPNVNEKKADHRNNKMEGGRGKRVLAASMEDETTLFLEP